MNTLWYFILQAARHREWGTSQDFSFDTEKYFSEVMKKYLLQEMLYFNRTFPIENLSEVILLRSYRFENS